MKLKHITKNLNLLTEITIPVLLICGICMFFGVKIINDELESQTSSHATKELESFKSHNLYKIKMDYESLFYMYGANKESFKEAQNFAKIESIAYISKNIAQTNYQGYIIDDGKVISLQSGGHLNKITVDDLKQNSLFLSNYISVYGDFLPWDWKVVFLHDNQHAMQIANVNTVLIFAFSILLMLVFVGVVVFIINITINIPLKKMMEHFAKLQNANVDDRLTIATSKETYSIAQNINQMTFKISQRENELIAQKEYYTNIINSQKSIVFVVNEKIVYTNNAFNDFFKFHKDFDRLKDDPALFAKLFSNNRKVDYFTPEDSKEWYKELSNRGFTNKIRVLRDSKAYIFNITSSVMKNSQNSYIVVLSDISTIEEYKNILEKQKNDLNNQLLIDSLTSMPNRYALNKNLEDIQIASLAIFNINDFKEINDFYGTKTGDKILYEYGQKINYFASIYKLNAYKLSADEYAVLFAGYKKIDSCISITQAITNLLDQESFTDESNERTIHLVSSVGITINTTPDAIFTQADIALKTAKKQQKSFMTYSNSLETKDHFATNRQMALEIKEAILHDNIVPYFQPIYNNQTRKIEKYEALMRIITRENKLLTPYFFLDVSKKSHQYLKLTEKMIEKTFYYMSVFDYEFSINVSDIDINDQFIRDMIIRNIINYNLQNRVIIEITETENIKDYDLVISFINEAKRFGAKIAIDDFGSGFSNFSHIAKLNVDFIKIDGLLIKNIMADKNSLIIVETIHNFAKKIGAKTIAEFVDNEAVFNKVVEIGIDYTQGYYISQPVSSIY